MQEILYYMDYHQPIYFDCTLPKGTFTAESIDPWEMTIDPPEGQYSGHTKIRLKAKPFQALRLRRI